MASTVTAVINLIIGWNVNYKQVILSIILGLVINLIIGWNVNHSIANSCSDSSSGY